MVKLKHGEENGKRKESLSAKMVWLAYDIGACASLDMAHILWHLHSKGPRRDGIGWFSGYVLSLCDSVDCNMAYGFKKAACLYNKGVIVKE
jgi:hypothetical protein